MSIVPLERARAGVQPGDRVFAIVGKRDDGKIGVFGGGVYRGREVPPADAPGWAGDLGRAGVDNPAILLDTGEVVFGCECWWGPEESTRARLGDAEVIVETVASFRARAAELHAAEGADP